MFFLLIFVIFTLLVIYGTFIESNWLKVNRISLRNFNDRISLNKRLVILFDPHIKRIGRRERKIINLVRGQKPDFILLGGDVVAFGKSFNSSLRFLRELSKIAKVYAVLGNIDHSNTKYFPCPFDEKGIRDLRTGDIFILNNENVKIEGNTTFFLLGVDDCYKGLNNLKRALRGVPESAKKILLSHSPLIFDQAVEERIDIVLAGHTHGGQIWMPKTLLRVLYRLLGHGLKYPRGYFWRGQTTMYVSSGLGKSMIPLRIGIRPEICVI